MKSLCEVLVLSLNSAPSKELENTSAGIERFDTYKHIVRVGEVVGKKLGMMVGETAGGGGFLVVGDEKKYR